MGAASAGGTDGDRASVTALQFLEQRLTDAGDLMHVAMTIDERRRMAEKLLEAIQLSSDFRQHLCLVDVAQQETSRQPAAQAGADRERCGASVCFQGDRSL